MHALTTKSKRNGPANGRTVPLVHNILPQTAPSVHSENRIIPKNVTVFAPLQ